MGAGWSFIGRDGRLLTGVRPIFEITKQATKRYAQGLRQFVGNADADLNLTQFDRADVGPVDSRVVRKILLRQADSFPSAAHYPAELLFNRRHGEQPVRLQSILPQTITIHTIVYIYRSIRV